jgi:hypothetical protein
MTDKKPDLTLQLTFPWSNDGSDPEARLRVYDETSSTQLFEFVLTGEQLLNLMAARQIRPEVKRMSDRLDVVGHEMTLWTEGFPEEPEALAFRISLQAAGWSVGSLPLSRTNSVERKFIVTGRRWDGQVAGTYCREHRRTIPAGHVCYGCANAHLRENGGTV